MRVPRKKSTRQRPYNPKCVTCSHPRTFHPLDQSTQQSVCKAFGCHCQEFVQDPAEEKIEL